MDDWLESGQQYLKILMQFGIFFYPGKDNIVDFDAVILFRFRCGIPDAHPPENLSLSDRQSRVAAESPNAFVLEPVLLGLVKLPLNLLDQSLDEGVVLFNVFVEFGRDFGLVFVETQPAGMIGSVGGGIVGLEVFDDLSPGRVNLLGGFGPQGKQTALFLIVDFVFAFQTRQQSGHLRLFDAGKAFLIVRSEGLGSLARGPAPQIADILQIGLRGNDSLQGFQILLADDVLINQLLVEFFAVFGVEHQRLIGSLQIHLQKPLKGRAVFFVKIGILFVVISEVAQLAHRFPAAQKPLDAGVDAVGNTGRKFDAFTLLFTLRLLLPLLPPEAFGFGGLLFRRRGDGVTIFVKKLFRLKTFPGASAPMTCSRGVARGPAALLSSSCGHYVA